MGSSSDKSGYSEGLDDSETVLEYIGCIKREVGSNDKCTGCVISFVVPFRTFPSVSYSTYKRILATGSLSTLPDQ